MAAPLFRKTSLNSSLFASFFRKIGTALPLPHLDPPKSGRLLGFEFLDCVESAVKSIIEQPEMYRVHYSVFRGCVIRRFPFSIFYTIERRVIVVHSVFDNRRDPDERP